MLRKLPGIDIPEANVHHAAAFLEFKWQVEMLAKEGQDLAAYTCWTHAIEARHSLLSAPLPVNLNCSLLWSKCLAAREIAELRSSTWKVQVPLGGAVEHPWHHHSARCSAWDAWAYYYKRLGRWASFLWQPTRICVAAFEIHVMRNEPAGTYKMRHVWNF